MAKSSQISEKLRPKHVKFLRENNTVLILLLLINITLAITDYLVPIVLGENVMEDTADLHSRLVK